MIHKILFAAILAPSDIGIPVVEANNSTLQNILGYVFVLAGAVSVLMVVIGGIRYIISIGDPQRISSAKNTILYALVGLVISLLAFVLVKFIFDAISDAPTTDSIGYSSVRLQ